MIQAINSIPGLRILGKPTMSVMAFDSPDFDIYLLGDEMDKRGWSLERQQMPPALHLVITPAHEAACDAIVKDLRAAAATLRKQKLRNGLNALQVRIAATLISILPSALVKKISARVSRTAEGDDEKAPGGTAVMYGMIGTMPDRANVNEFIADFLDQQTRVQ